MNNNKDQQLKEELSRLKEENSALKKRLESADEKLAQLQYLLEFRESTPEIAHEINNSVNFVKSSVKVIERGVKDFIDLMSKYRLLKGFEEQQEYYKIRKLEEDIDVPLTEQEMYNSITIIYNGFERVQEIAHNLSLMGIQAETEHDKVDINKQIEAVLFMFKNKAGDDIEIEKKLGEIPLVTFGIGKLDQVFTNLIKNAIEAIYEKQDVKNGRLSISTHLDGNMVIINIADNGIGMTEETIERLYEKFYTTKSPGKGTGLGMGVTKNIIESHNGSIKVESERGKGTKFTISIPVD